MDYIKDAQQIAHILRACEAMDLAMADSHAVVRKVLDLTHSRPNYSIWKADRDLGLTDCTSFDVQTVMNVAHVLGCDMTSPA